MIQIPENLQKIYQDNTIKSLALLDGIKEPDMLSLDEYQNFYQAKIFIDKLKMDCWIMCRQLWEKVWLSAIENLEKIKENMDPNYIRTPEEAFDLCNDIKVSDGSVKHKASSDEPNNVSIFTVAYPVSSSKNINFCFIIDWEKQNLGSYCCLDEAGKNKEIAIISKDSEYNMLQQNNIYAFNESKYHISLNKKEISNSDIEELKKATEEIITYYNKNKKEILSRQIIDEE